MKSKSFLSLGIIQSFIALGAIPAGFLMIINPDGTKLGMTTDFLANTPFYDFLIPGIFLFIVNGLFNLGAAILSFKKHKYSGVSGLMLGIALVLWIVIQVYFIQLSSFLQPLFFFIGVIEIIISLFIIKQYRQANRFSSN